MYSFLVHVVTCTKLQHVHDIYTLCKLRTTNHKLPIETGRWNGIDRENRQCLKCNSRSIGDEFHYIMECHFFTENRTQLMCTSEKNKTRKVM